MALVSQSQCRRLSRREVHDVSDQLSTATHTWWEEIPTECRGGIPAVAAKHAAQLVAKTRATPLRIYDQIPMRTEDLARQAILMAPLLAGNRVAFVGDMDGTASVLGLLAVAGWPAPAQMLVLDFDDRVLNSAVALAEQHGFSHLLTVDRYNCFDPISAELLGKFDWFYTNPPYGSHNEGESARLFLTRGCELVQQNGGSGCLILPDDSRRQWTRRAMDKTEHFLRTHGWEIRAQFDQLHQYHLDDDPDLASSLILVDRTVSGGIPTMPFANRRVEMHEILNFYGRNIFPPYPTFIREDGIPVGISDGA